MFNDIDRDDPQVLMIAWGSYATAINHLVQAEVLGLDALELLRQDLRVGMWKAENVPETHRTQHATLLNDITEQIVEHRPALRAYYEGAGDIHPSAPDDLASLGDGAP